MQKSLASPTDKVSDFRHISPDFPVLYGGYYIAFGAEWCTTDFADSDWFYGKLSAMLMTGT
jgi:hypothetical protein